MTNQRTINWKEKADQFKLMTTCQLLDALSDIRKTLPAADAMDRETGSCEGGYYRDEASIIHKEIISRR